MTRTAPTRVCEAAGCTNSLEGRDPRARFCGTSCRARAWKASVDYGHHDGSRQRPAKSRANGQPRGVTVSYTKARTALATFAASFTWVSPEDLDTWAGRALDGALTDRQRRRLTETRS